MESELFLKAKAVVDAFCRWQADPDVAPDEPLLNALHELVDVLPEIPTRPPEGTAPSHHVNPPFDASEAQPAKQEGFYGLADNPSFDFLEKEELDGSAASASPVQNGERFGLAHFLPISLEANEVVDKLLKQQHAKQNGEPLGDPAPHAYWCGSILDGKPCTCKLPRPVTPLASPIPAHWDSLRDHIADALWHKSKLTKEECAARAAECIRVLVDPTLAPPTDVREAVDYFANQVGDMSDADGYMEAKQHLGVIRNALHTPLPSAEVRDAAKVLLELLDAGFIAPENEEADYQAGWDDAHKELKDSKAALNLRHALDLQATPPPPDAVREAAQKAVDACNAWSETPEGFPSDEFLNAMSNLEDTLTSPPLPTDRAPDPITHRLRYLLCYYASPGKPKRPGGPPQVEVNAEDFAEMVQLVKKIATEKTLAEISTTEEEIHRMTGTPIPGEDSPPGVPT